MSQERKDGKPRDEYKVRMRLRNGRRVFTLVNAYSPGEAIKRVANNHPDNEIIGWELTGRQF